MSYELYSKSLTLPLWYNNDQRRSQTKSMMFKSDWAWQDEYNLQFIEGFDNWFLLEFLAHWYVYASSGLKMMLHHTDRPQADSRASMMMPSLRVTLN